MKVFDRYQRVEKAMINAVAESYVQGVSTRKIRKDGYREILGAMIAESEDDVNWEDFFEDLKSRGLRGVKLVISDGHKGIKKAVEKKFLGASWQLCVTHFMRSVLKRIRKKDKNEGHKYG